MQKFNDYSDKNWAIGIFLSSLALYSLTMAPTVIWGDSANFALMVDQFLLDPAADGHPLYIILGKIFSFLPGELALNLNFMSAFFAAMAVALVYLVAARIVKDKIAASLGALAFALSHSFWLHAVVSEVYTLNACFLMAVIYLLLKWKNQRRDSQLYWGAFLYGLGLSNHLVLGLLGISILYFLFIYDRKIFTDKRFLIILLCFFLGLSVYLGVLIYWMKTLPEKSSEIADIATGRGHKQWMMNLNLAWLLGNVKMYCAYLFYQFPLAGFWLGFLGLIKFFRRDKKLACFFMLAIAANAAFFIAGPPTFGGSNYTFYIQDYAIFSVLIAYGCHCLIKRRGQRFVLLLLSGLLLTPLFVYNITPVLAKKMGIDLLHARELPYRDNEAYFLNPPKGGYYGPEKYALAVMEKLEPNAIIIADYTPAAVLEYYQKVLGARPDVKIVYVQDACKGVGYYDLKPYVLENYRKGPIYIADKPQFGYYNVDNLTDEYHLVTLEPIYKIVKNN